VKARTTSKARNSFDILKKSRKAYANNFTEFYLRSLQRSRLKVMSLYHIGTSKHWQGATVFGK
jgi:hypothetical protein